MRSGRGVPAAWGPRRLPARGWAAVTAPSPPGAHPSQVSSCSIVASRQHIFCFLALAPGFSYTLTTTSQPRSGEWAVNRVEYLHVALGATGLHRGLGCMTPAAPRNLRPDRQPGPPGAAGPGACAQSAHQPALQPVCGTPRCSGVTNGPVHAPPLAQGLECIQRGHRRPRLCDVCARRGCAGCARHHDHAAQPASHAPGSHITVLSPAHVLDPAARPGEVASVPWRGQTAAGLAAL